MELILKLFEGAARLLFPNSFCFFRSVKLLFPNGRESFVFHRICKVEANVEAKKLFFPGASRVKDYVFAARQRKSNRYFGKRLASLIHSLKPGNGFTA